MRTTICFFYLFFAPPFFLLLVRFACNTHRESPLQRAKHIGEYPDKRDKERKRERERDDDN